MYLEANGTSLYYEKAGEGPPVVLLHGNGEDHTIFDVLTRGLERDYTVYALDSRGHGKSGKTEKYSYEVMAEDVSEFLRALHLEKSLLYGFSDGGIVGLLLASRYPELLSKLAVSGANLTPGGLKPLYRFFFRIGYLFSRNKRVLMMLKQPQISSAMLSRIPVPTLVLAGEKDLIQEEHTRLIAGSIPRGELRILPGELHGSYVVHSGKLVPLLSKFFQD